MTKYPLTPTEQQIVDEYQQYASSDWLASDAKRMLLLYRPDEILDETSENIYNELLKCGYIHQGVNVSDAKHRHIYSISKFREWLGLLHDGGYRLDTWFNREYMEGEI